MIVALGVMGCGKNETAVEATETAPGAAAKAPAVAGEVKDTEFFHILVPRGWEFVDFGRGSLQVYNRGGTYMVEVKSQAVASDDKILESTLEMTRARYDGTPIERVEMLGLNFFKTTFTAHNRLTTMYTAGNKDGRKISITLYGPDHPTDPGIQAVLKSLVIK